MEAKESQHFEAYIPRPNRWYEVHARPSPEMLSVYFRNITAREAMAASLNELSVPVLELKPRLLLLPLVGRNDKDRAQIMFSRLMTKVAGPPVRVWPCGISPRSMAWTRSSPASSCARPAPPISWAAR